MKTILLLTILSFSLLQLRGQGEKGTQINSGKVTYEEKIKIEIKLEGDAAQFAANLPKERKSEKVLQFTPEATLFTDGPNVEEEMAVEQSEGVHIRMVTGGNNMLYTDLKNKVILDQRDFMNRMFIVEKPIVQQGWKVTGNQKMIQGYNCMEATKQDTSGKKTIAWFTPSIQVQGGPSGLNGLPGLILEADFDNGSRIYTTRSIEELNSKELKLEKPKEGKKVTEEEFKKIVADKMKEMGIEDTGSGSTNQVKIMIRR